MVLPLMYEFWISIAVRTSDSKRVVVAAEFSTVELIKFELTICEFVMLEDEMVELNIKHRSMVWF